MNTSSVSSSQLPGKLYIVSTPIGNLDDFTKRAIDTLQAVSLVAAEDTRHSGKLFNHFGIKTPTISLHDYNEGERAHKIIEVLLSGEDVALVSDAGTPLISDPGYTLVSLVSQHDVDIVPVVGACALVAALAIAGLPTDRFAFEGFLPAKTAQRKKRLEALQGEERTLVLYESKHRIISSLQDFSEVWGDEREGVVCRELTKAYESVYRGKFKDIAASLVESDAVKGEFVIVTKGKDSETKGVLDISTEALKWLEALVSELPIKKAAAIVATRTGYSKNQLYKLALERFNQ